MEKSSRYRIVLEAVETFARKALELQILDESDKDYGGFRCPEQLVCEPWVAANTFSVLTMLYFTRDSTFYTSPELLERMQLALQFVLKSQYPDGTIDAYFCGDMRAASNVAFAVHPLARAYRVLSRRHDEYQDMLTSLETFLKRSAEALICKPVFTPNHRWVAASALVEIDKLFVDHRAILKAEDYLRDSIDINNDGLYSEKSPVYNMLSNAMLLNIAKKLDKPILMEEVRRSLKFSLYNFYANGEVVTEYSNRKDAESGLPSGYPVWKEMSIIDHNGYFASASDLTLEMYLKRMDDGFLRPYVNNPDPNFRKEKTSRFLATSNIGELLAAELELNNDAVIRLPIQDVYEKVFPESNIVRIRNGKMSATIMGDNQILFALQNGNVIIDGFRIKYAYYGHRDFTPEELEADNGKYILWDEFTRWECGPTAKRREIMAVDLQIVVTIERIDNGVEMHILARGWERIPLQLEFGLRKQGKVTLGTSEYDLSATDIIFLGTEPAHITYGDDAITIKGGITEHKIYSFDDNWTMNHNTTRLLVTPMTPYEGRIRILCH